MKKSANIYSKKFIKSVSGSDKIFSDSKTQIAFIGRSNVGKSSIINSLVRERNLAKSSSKPGKTQRLNFFLINDKFYFVDLPGYGYSKTSNKIRDKIWKMIEWYITKSSLETRGEQFFILIIDANVLLTDFDREILKILIEFQKKFLIVFNKVDKVNQKQLNSINKIMKEMSLNNNDYILFSCIKEKYKTDLLNFILHL